MALAIPLALTALVIPTYQPTYLSEFRANLRTFPYEIIASCMPLSVVPLVVLQ